MLLARDRIAEQHGLWLFGGLQPTGVPAIVKFELVAGDAAMGLDLGETATAFGSLVSI